MNVSLFYNVLEMSLNASFIILIVLAMRLYLKVKPKVFSYVLWIAVFLRLLCPITYELPISFVPKDVSSGIAMKEVADTYVGGQEKHWNYTEEFDKALKQGHVPVLQMDEAGAISSAYVITGKNEISKPDTVYDTVLPVFCRLWMLGVAGLICYSFISYVKLKKKLSGAVPFDEEKDIYLSDYIDTAFVIGFFYPKIYLPSALSGKEQDYILLHEQQHIRRKDHWIKIAAFLALCIHWFNPLVWIAFFEMTKDMEMSCDEAVLKRLGSSIQKEYAASLLGLATGKRVVAAMPLAFGEGDTKVRIANVMRWKRASRKAVVLTGIFCMFVGTVSLANAENNAMSHPYEWTSTVTAEDIEECAAVSWKNESVKFAVTKAQKEDFVYILNQLSKYDMTKENKKSQKEISVLFACGEKEILLTYGEGLTQISFSGEMGFELEQNVWQTSNKPMAKAMENLIRHGTVENKTEAAALTEEEVLAMRQKVLEGMSSQEAERLKELVKVENQTMERRYLHENQFADFKDPESPYWKVFTQSGTIQLGWGVSCAAPEFDPDGDMTEEEYYAVYGTPFVIEIEVPEAKRFYAFIDELRDLVKNELLKDDFDELEEYMRLAVETQDINYLYQIYYKLHDLDYFLLRYGPKDVGKYTMDDSTVSKYYDALFVYRQEG